MNRRNFIELFATAVGGIAGGLGVHALTSKYLDESLQGYRNIIKDPDTSDLKKNMAKANKVALKSTHVVVKTVADFGGVGAGAAAANLATDYILPKPGDSEPSTPAP